MEIIPPVALEVVSSGSNPTYTDQAWAVGNYDQYDRVRHVFDGIWHSFRAKYAFYSSVPPRYLYDSRKSPWEYLGLSTVSGGYTYYADEVALSLNSTWVSGNSGQPLVAGSVRYDPSDHSDYVALTDISSGDNTVYPSDAVLSADDTIAGYWKKLDAANAWASIDYSLATKTSYVKSDGTIITYPQLMNYRFVSPSVNLIAAPNEFNTTWTTSDSAVTANNQVAPVSSNPVTADTLTAGASASVSTPGYLTRTFSSVKAGSRVVFAVYVRSADYTSFTVRFREGSTDKVEETFTITPSWRYVQVYHEVTADCNFEVWIGLINTPAKTLVLWGAHFGYVSGAFNRFAVIGAENVSKVTVALTPWADVPNATYGNSSNTTVNFAAAPRSDLSATSSVIASVFRDDSTTIQSNTGLIYATSTFVVGLVVTPRDPFKPAAIGAFGVGEATVLGGTEWGVESSLLSFSRKERDATFGTVTFVKRGSARQVRATAYIDTDIISGDEVQSVLEAFDGEPVFYDFNNEGRTYDRLRVFGFHTNVRTLIQAPTWESLSIDIEGLVE